jgi:hypothetical protein
MARLGAATHLKRPTSEFQARGEKCPGIAKKNASGYNILPAISSERE